jgi:hypothetical protein
MKPYSDSIEHLHAELSRLDLLLRRAILISRRPGQGAGPDEFRGLVVTENEIDDILCAKDLVNERWERARAREPELGRIDNELDKRRQEIDSRVKASWEKGVYLTLPSLAAQFALSQAEVDILLVALAPALEPQYEMLYSYLQNDVTRKHPSVNLALNLICRSEREKLNAREIFCASAPLAYHCILDLGEESQDRHPSLLRKYLKIDEPVVRFLLGQTPNVLDTGTLVTPNESCNELEIGPSTRKQLENLASHLMQSKKGVPVIRLVGRSETALHDAAGVLCRALGYRMLLLELAQLNDESRLAKSLRDARLWRAAFVVESGERTEPEAESQRRQAEALLWRRLQDFKEPVVLLGPPDAFLQVAKDLHWCRVEVEPLDFHSRRETWNSALAGQPTEADTSRLADAFSFGHRRIRQAINLASGFAALRDPSNAYPSGKDLLDAGRVLISSRVARFVVRVEPRYGWDDIVLPADKMRQLRSIAAWMRFRRRVHEDWGFGRKLSRGKGLNVLLTGASGTGKTMAAEILARELALELLQIDLSSVVSKYIGETEKNLGAIFREAEQSQALLFFDEADSLFGKRTEVKDAHDRYANIEVNYLLQQVELYEGVVVLATNLQRNLDDAFLRRIKEVVDFPFPDETLRERIWLNHLPREAPRDPDIDFQFLARQLKLTGGQIKNIVLDAAFLAAEEQRPIKMADLILAAKSEFRKEGKLCTKSDFGPYYDLVQKTG